MDGRLDDRVLPATRALSVLIIPFLAAGFGILYLFPGHTRELFAWTLKPAVAAMTLGATYLGGVYFFLRSATAGRWHTVQAGFPPIAAFAGLLGIATVLHWGRFNHGHLSFVVWSAIYFTTPFLVLAAWLRNRARDPGRLSPEQLQTPIAARWALAVSGLLVLAVGAVFFLLPALAIGVWPWALTPLTARVLAAMLVLAGVAQVSVAADGRWTAARTTLESQLLALAFMILAAVLARGDLAPANPLSWAWAGGLLAVAVGIAGLMYQMRGWRPAPS